MIDISDHLFTTVELAYPRDTRLLHMVAACCDGPLPDDVVDLREHIEEAYAKFGVMSIEEFAVKLGLATRPT